MSINIAAGEIYAPAPLEATAYSTIHSDTSHTLTKQGYADAQSFAIAAPVTSGQSINYLVQ